MDLFAVADGVARDALVFAAEAGHEEARASRSTCSGSSSAPSTSSSSSRSPGRWRSSRSAGSSHARRERIEQGLKDADAARRDREAAADQRQAVLAEARREANDIIVRAQRSADEAREQGVAETRAEIERLREQAVSGDRRGAPAGARRGPCPGRRPGAPGRRQGGGRDHDRRRASAGSWTSSWPRSTGPGPAAAERN